jgi:hypothetical protein
MYNGLNLDPAPMELAKVSSLNPDVVSNLRVMNGLKVFLTLYILYGNTYLYTYYSIVADPVQANNYRLSFWFVFVSSSMFATPCLFWIAGFLHTFSFMKTVEEKGFTLRNILSFYFKRVIRFFPLVFATLLFAMTIVPAIGGGPTWQTYKEQVMKGCDKYWWTNLLFINNIVPTSSFEDKCMPWSWFLPCLLQVSLILPPLLFVYSKLVQKSFVLSRIMFGIIILLCWVLIFTATYDLNVGSVPITILPVNDPETDVNKLFYIDFQFYNKVYMQPWYWIAVYCSGVLFGTAFCHYINDKNSQEPTGPTEFFNKINDKGAIRALVYLLVLFFMLFGVLR